MKLPGKRDVLFLVPIILVHVVFFMLAMHFKRIYMGDSYEYVYMALNIKEHFLFYSANASLPIMLKNYTLRPPGYSLFLLIFYLFTVNNWVVIFFQNMLSVFNIFYLRKTISLLGYREKYDWLLVLLVLAYPAQFIFTNTIASEILLQTFVLIYFRHFLLLIKEGQAKHAWITSLVLTFGLFTKPILYPFVAVHFLLLLIVSFKGNSYKKYWATILFPVLAILSYNFWNAARTGKFHFSSIQPINALNYNTRLFLEHKVGKVKTAVFMQHEKQKMDTMPFKEWYDYGNQRSKEILKENFLSYAIFHARFIPIFFIHPGKSDIDLFTGALTYGTFYEKKSEPVTSIFSNKSPKEIIQNVVAQPALQFMFIILFFNLIKCIGFVFFIFDKDIKFLFRLIPCILLFYFAFITGPITNTRFHIPVSLVFIGCAVMGLQRLSLLKNNRSIIMKTNIG